MHTVKNVGIIGVGKLGLCLALNLERVGFNVLGIEKDDERLKLIKEKTLRTSEPDVETMLQDSKNLTISDDFRDLTNLGIEVIFIVVATPSQPDGAFSHSTVDSVMKELEGLGRSSERKTLVINSTTMPGYCNSLVNRLDDLNYDLIYNPEFIAQGSIIRDQQNPDQILIGAENEMGAELVKSIYETLCPNKPEYCIMDLQSAEISKLATNCFLTMKISFANHIGDLAIKVGADPHKILDCVGSDKRIGKKYLNYGFGFGGPCFPRDNKAMLHFGSENDHQLHLSESTDRINEEHFEFQLHRLIDQDQTEYYFEDVAYKEGSDIIEESQQLRLAIALAEHGAKVRIKASGEIQTKLNSMHPGLFHFEES